MVQNVKTSSSSSLRVSDLFSVFFVEFSGVFRGRKTIIIILFAIRQLQMYPIKTHTQIARTSKINTPYLIIIRFFSSSKNPSPFCSWKYLSYPNVTLLGIYQSIST